MKPTLKQPALLERISSFRAELDAFIDAKAEEMKTDAPDVPVGVLRNLITNRAFGCQCQAVQNMVEGQ